MEDTHGKALGQTTRPLVIAPFQSSRSYVAAVTGWSSVSRQKSAVEEALQHARHHFTPEMIVYVAGCDPYKDDPLGSLQLTKPGLLARDQRVARFARQQRCPLVALPAGGYSSDSPAITAATFRAIAEIEGLGGKEEANP